MLLVTVNISRQLGLPIVTPTLGHSTAEPARRFVVPVPVTTVNKDNLTATAEYDVGRPWQSAIVQPVPVAQRVKEPPDRYFGLRILGSDQSHSLTALP